jgi:hypothetical protein
VCDCSDQAAHYHNLGPKLGASLLTRHIGWKQKKKEKKKWTSDRLCGLVVSVEDYKHRGAGFDSRALLRIFLRELGLEQGPLSLVTG